MISDPERERIIPDELRLGQEVVALVDADGKGAESTPRHVLLCDQKIRVILASSPRGPEERKWLKQSNTAESQRLRMLDVWSDAELVITGYDSFSSHNRQ
jgi:hypothetical protein